MGVRLLLLSSLTLLALTGCVRVKDGLNLVPTTEYVVELDLKALERAGEDPDDATALLGEVVPQIRRRLEGADMPPSQVTMQGEGRLLIQVTGSNTRKLVERVLGIPVEFELNLAKDSADETDQLLTDARFVSMPLADGSGQILVRKDKGIDGGSLLNAMSTYDPVTDEPGIALTLNNHGNLQLAQLTKSNVGKQLAIIVEGKVMSAPFILEPILGGEILVSGGFSQEQANELAIQIRAGALPTPLRIIEEREVD